MPDYPQYDIYLNDEFKEVREIGNAMFVLEVVLRRRELDGKLTLHIEMYHTMDSERCIVDATIVIPRLFYYENY